MATEADLIVSAFATPPQQDMRAMAQDEYLFAARPVVVGVPYQQYMKPEHQGIASRAFTEAADRLRSPSGSILENFFAKFAKGLHPRSVTLIGFSAGCSFVKRCLDSPDADWIDAVVALDGVHIAKDWKGDALLSEAEPWISFGLRAARDERLLVVANTAIVPSSQQITSTRQSSALLIEQIWERSRQPVQPPVVSVDWELLTAGPPPPAVSITGGLPKATKTFSESPLQSIDQIGNFWALDYGGSIGCDHIYVAWYGQRDIWRALLAPRLNHGAVCKLPPLAGLAEQCLSNRVLIPADVYPATPILATLGPMLGGLLAGTAVGYAFGKAVGR
jgi:hypothetical protein